MDAALQRRVQRYGWDRAAQHYEKFWSAQLRPAQDLLLELADLHAGDHVLDVACGTGLVTLRAASIVGASGRVVGTDLSAAMVESLRALAAAHGIAGEFERMDAEALRFADGTFDAALCALGLMYVPDPPRALAELRRVLRPRGRVVAAQSHEGGPRNADAVYAVLGWQRGKFEFNAFGVDMRDEVEMSTTGLLMEAARRLDEAQRT